MRNDKAIVHRYFHRLLEDFPEQTKGWQFDLTERNTYRIIKKIDDKHEIFLFGARKRNSGEMVGFLDSLHAYFHHEIRLKYA